MDTKQLICEGACNPGLKKIDELIKRVGREIAASDVADFARTAVYTTHTSFVSELYTCDVCGTQRWFGGTRYRFEGAKDYR